MGSMSRPNHGAAYEAREEQAAFERVVDRVTSQFPEVDREAIIATVRGAYGRFEASTIRDFVPILVERSVRAELAQRA
jgi:hypothetical protein